MEAKFSEETARLEARLEAEKARLEAEKVELEERWREEKAAMEEKFMEERTALEERLAVRMEARKGSDHRMEAAKAKVQVCPLYLFILLVNFCSVVVLDSLNPDPYLNPPFQVDPDTDLDTVRIRIPYESGYQSMVLLNKD